MSLVIGVPKEHRYFEYRVGLTPLGVSILSKRGYQCYVETGAGVGSGFPDAEYEHAGARIAYGKDEVFRRADLILKVQRPTQEEVDWMRGDQVVMSFMMLSIASESRVHSFAEKNITTIAYELIENGDGRLPVLYPLSQIGGRMTAQIAARYLQNDKGGKGMLLGGAVSVPPADVVIVGAGVVGTSAAEAFLGMGARVILLDKNMKQLQLAHNHLNSRVTTMVSHDFNLARVCTFADVLVGAIQVPGQRSPQIITREMVRSMRSHSVIIDMSIDQGGCVQTSRPTLHDQPTFVAEDVIHYCVPNVPGVIGRTATHAFLNAAWPYILEVADKGVDAAVEQNPALECGVTFHGRVAT
ncbi:MAG: alanine dehydrogenase [Anaerolineaceae bacterium]|nr:alanine dehydrogenase [Anaerolineaceae bacterium]